MRINAHLPAILYLPQHLGLSFFSQIPYTGQYLTIIIQVDFSIPKVWHEWPEFHMIWIYLHKSRWRNIHHHIVRHNGSLQVVMTTKHMKLLVIMLQIQRFESLHLLKLVLWLHVRRSTYDRWVMHHDEKIFIITAIYFLCQPSPL